MILSSHGIVASSIGQIDADALAFFARVDSATSTTDFLTTTEKTAINKLVLDLKANSLWTPMKAIYPMVGGGTGTTAQRQAACSQNLKSSSFTGTFTAGWTFASTGVKGNGTSSYFNTTFNAVTELITAANFTLGGYQRIQQLREEILFGNSLGTGTPRVEMYARQSTGGYFLNLGGNFINATNTDARGFYLGKSNSLGTISEGYKNGSLFMSGLSTAVMKNANMWLGGINGYSAFSSNEFAFAFLGDGQLSATDVTNYYNSVQAFQTTLSRQV